MILAMLGLSVLIAISAAATDGGTSAGTQASAPSAAAVPAPAGGGRVDDPTGSDGWLTATTAHGLAEIRRVHGPAILSASCWDAHAWNPSSDHPKGRACDIYTSPSGKFAAGTGLDRGNELVSWLRANAAPLQVSYVIWQGRFWSPQRGERAYTGGGVYDPDDPVGGHYDHVHVSFRK